MNSTNNSANQNSSLPILGRGVFWWLLISALIIVIDQLTKQSVIENFSLYQRLSIFPILDLVRLHNTGAAFSFLAGASGWQNHFFVGVAIVLSIGILVWMVRTPRSGYLTLLLGLSMIFGGAIGNLIDRIQHGYVVDFILFYYQDWSFPAFNAADSAIFCGVVLVLIDGFILDRRRAT